MKKSFKSRSYFFLSSFLDKRIRLKGYRVFAQYLDVILTFYVCGFKYFSPVIFELTALKYEKRKARNKS